MNGLVILQMKIVHNKGVIVLPIVKRYKPYVIPLLVLVIILIFLFGLNIHAYAAGSSEDIANTGVGADLGTFNNTLKTIANGIIKSAKVIVVIMTALAGTMVAFGIQDGKKTTWNIILGIGLALNFGSFLYTAYGSYIDMNSTTATVTQYEFDLKGKDGGGVDILSGFMNNYTQNVIVPGAKAIIPIAAKLLIILTMLDATMKLAFDLISGDKVKFLLKTTLISGFYLFLILNWLDGLSLMQALSNGFESIGFIAGGADGDTVLKPDSIVNNAIALFNAVWDKAKFSLLNLGPSIINLVSIVAIVVCLFLTAIEMFMARIEFYTMALITIPLLPFGCIGKFRFLSEKAIGAMFNLAIKVCVIAFISTMSVPMLKSFTDKFQDMSKTAGFFEQINVILQAVLVAFILFILTKKIPALVQGLLSGQPSLGGSDMKQMAMSTATTAAAAAGIPAKAMGAIRGASNMAGGGNAMMKAAAKSGGAVPSRMSRMGGTAANLAKLAYLQNPMSRGFQSVAKSVTDQNSHRISNRSVAPPETRMQNPIAATSKYAVNKTTAAASSVYNKVKSAMSSTNNYQSTASKIADTVNKNKDKDKK